MLSFCAAPCYPVKQAILVAIISFKLTRKQNFTSEKKCCLDKSELKHL